MDGLLMAATPWFLSWDWWANGLQAALGLGVVIFVHELGHFMAAKACGVKCEKFYVGFDVPIRLGPIRLPRSLVRFQWGETEYGIGILPLGGYVKMLGQDDDPRNAQAESDRTKIGGEEGEPLRLDPRSYPAKSVPQRMLIISAGVIMNLIFAVLFAAVAYRQGVPYTPCEVGNVIGGSPAWNAGIREGDRIIQIGRTGVPNSHLRYDWDLIQGVGLNGDQDLDFLLRRPDGKEDWVTLRPRIVSNNGVDRPMIGILTSFSTKLADTPAIPNQPAEKAGFQGKDEIIAVDGEPVASYADFVERAWKAADKPLEVTVKRGDATTTVTVEPNRRRGFGIVPEAGPVLNVRLDSPASLAGVKPGDQFKTLNGEPIGDLSTLPHRLRAYFGQEIELGIVRPTAKGGVESLVVKATPQAPRVGLFVEDPALLGLLSVDALGITYKILPVIASVTPDLPAAQAGLAPGDKILTCQIVPPAGKEQEFKEKYGPQLTEPIVLDDSREHWLMVDSFLQAFPEGAKLKVEVARDKEKKTVELTPVEVAEYLPMRGMRFTPKSEIYVAQSWSEALALGARQTREDASRILTMVKRLVTGKISFTNLGGPLSIMRMASAEASQGSSRLLMFLTFLSANLAVLNFLPIPALDGGHMVFLTYEGIFRRPVNERVQVALTLAGVACLISLMVVVFGLDIWRFR
ncbi:MAG: site-2 protease family protein [Pirellulales bacterium]